MRRAAAATPLPESRTSWTLYSTSSTSYLPLVEHIRVVRRPGQADRLAFKLPGVVLSVHVRTHRHQLLPAIEVHDVARRHSRVDDLPDAPRLDGHADVGRLALRQHVDLLRPHDKADAVAEEDIGDADEVGDELGRGPLVDVHGGTDLLDPAARHHRHAVAHGKRLLLIMSDVDESDANLFLDLLQLDLHLLAQLEVQRSERLVEQ